jgi:hypothetical protein
MDDDISHSEMKHLCEKSRRKNDEKYRSNSKKRLAAILAKKFTTTMIAPLDLFEKSFGELWGHGQHVNDLTPTQRRNREIWQEIRSKVLDNGNNQLRASLEELDLYTISWNRFQTNFIVKKPEE